VTQKFAYKAIGKDGKPTSGTLEAADRQAVIALLGKRGARPLSVQPLAGSKFISGGNIQLFGPPRVKAREMILFTRQLSTLVGAGVPLTRSLVTLEEQAESKAFKVIIHTITKDIESGSSMGEAFAKHPQVFSEVYINMIRAGEEGGILDQILKRIALQTEKDASIKKKVKGAMTYPMVIMVISVVAFFGLMMFVIPKIGKIIKDLGGPNAHLPIYTEIMLGFSNFCLSHSIMGHIPLISMIPLIGKLPNVLFMIGAMVGGTIYGLRYIKTPKGKLQFDTLILRIPIINVIIIKVAVSRFARTFSALTAAGVTVLNALEITGGAIGNKVIENELKEAATQVRNGKPLSEPLSQSKVFPPIVAQMLAVGEETGQLDSILVKVADFYDEEVDTVIGSLSSIIEPVMIVVLGSLVGLIAASVMGPIASLSQNVGG
jgi:type IV pilus assembly protein PilC